jgi:alginate O-acetyltransferase complex protein AlgI
MAIVYLKRMFAFNFVHDGLYFDGKFYGILMIAVFFSFYGGFSRIEKWQEYLYREGKPLRIILPMFMLSVIIFVISLGFITSSGFNPFIYFRF